MTVKSFFEIGNEFSVADNDRNVFACGVFNFFAVDSADKGNDDSVLFSRKFFFTLFVFREFRPDCLKFVFKHGFVVFYRSKFLLKRFEFGIYFRENLSAEFEAERSVFGKFGLIENLGIRSESEFFLENRILHAFGNEVVFDVCFDVLAVELLKNIEGNFAGSETFYRYRV